MEKTICSQQAHSLTIKSYLKGALYMILFYWSWNCTGWVQGLEPLTPQASSNIKNKNKKKLATYFEWIPESSSSSYAHMVHTSALYQETGRYDTRMRVWALDSHLLSDPSNRWSLSVLSQHVVLSANSLCGICNVGWTSKVFFLGELQYQNALNLQTHCTI